MATCNVSELLSDARCFLALTEKQLDIVTLQLVREWAGDTSTPAELMEAAKCFNALETKNIDVVTAQLLCNIAG